MPGKPGCTVYVGNLDEKMSDRVLYEILIQAGRLVDMYIPRDKETQRIKGYAFAEYESEEIAEYAVRLFSGLVSLHNKTLKFAISGQDKASHNSGTPLTPYLDSSSRQRPQPMPLNYNEQLQHPSPLSTPLPFSRISSYGHSSDIGGSGFDYSRRAFGSTVDSIRHETHLSQPAYDSRHPIPYPF